jgi:tetratricopeptide (TPR) repeat protein
MKRSRVAHFFLAGLTIVANGSVAQADSSAEKEADEYMQTWEERGREACKDNERGCAAAGHALDRAAAAYEKAGKLEKAMAIRKMILDPQWHLDYTDYGRAAAFTLAQNLQSLTEYAEAAQIIETAVRRFSKSDEAPDALSEAMMLRLALGETDRALEDLQLFSKNYGTKRSADMPGIIVAMGTHLWDKGRSKELSAFLDKWMPSVDRPGNIHQRVLAHALAGRVHAHGGATAKAAAEFEIVRGLWARPDDAVKQINALGGTEDEQLRRLGQTLTAVGEALFFFAEQKRAEAEAIRFPEYTGSGDKDSVLKFISTKVSDWMKKKRPAIEDAEREYQKILHIQPAPPPRWVIASGGRVGFLWSTFVSEFRRAPMPKEWNSSAPLPGTSTTGTQVKKMYLEQLSSVSEPDMAQSKQAFRVCVDYSVKFQWADEHSLACIRWLEKNDRKAWIPVDELKPQPMHMALPIKTALIMPP